jgi:hypothetical protein
MASLSTWDKYSHIPSLLLLTRTHCAGRLQKFIGLCVKERAIMMPSANIDLNYRYD